MVDNLAWPKMRNIRNVPVFLSDLFGAARNNLRRTPCFFRDAPTLCCASLVPYPRSNAGLALLFLRCDVRALPLDVGRITA
jgi:hypothetical protein